MAHQDWVVEQLRTIDAAGDTTVVSVMDRPIVVTLQRGAKTGEERRVPLMRVEHEGSYAAVASKGGAPQNPVWYNNLVVHPDIEVMDGASILPVRARLVDPDTSEYSKWWDRSVAAYPPYAEYQEKTTRRIPIFLLEPR